MKTPEQKAQELLLCPFCGSRATEIPQAGDYRVQCSSTTCFLGCSQLQLLPSQWNARHFASEPVETACTLGCHPLGMMHKQCPIHGENGTMWKRQHMLADKEQHPSPDKSLEHQKVQTLVHSIIKELGIKEVEEETFWTIYRKVNEHSSQATAKLREEFRNKIEDEKRITKSEYERAYRFECEIKKLIFERDSLLADIKVKDRALEFIILRYANDSTVYNKMRQALKPNCGRKDEVE